MKFEENKKFDHNTFDALFTHDRLYFEELCKIIQFLPIDDVVSLSKVNKPMYRMTRHRCILEMFKKDIMERFLNHKIMPLYTDLVPQEKSIIKNRDTNVIGVSNIVIYDNLIKPLFDNEKCSKFSKCINFIKPNDLLIACIANSLVNEFITREMWFSMLHKDGMILQFVVDQTYEFCLTALHNNGLALQYVNKQTDELRIIAFTNNELALQYFRGANQRLYNILSARNNW